MKEKIHSYNLQNQQSPTTFKLKPSHPRLSGSPSNNEESNAGLGETAISENHSRLDINLKSNQQNRAQTKESINSIFSNLKPVTNKKQKKQLNVMFSQANQKSQKESAVGQSKSVLKKQIKNVKNLSLFNKLPDSSKIFSPTIPQKTKNPVLQLFYSNTGIRFTFIQQVIHTIVSALITIALIIILSIEIALDNIDDTRQFQAVKIIVLVIFGFYIGFNFFTVKKSRGKRIQHLNQIIKHYLTNQFAIDFLSFIALLVNVSCQIQQIKYSMFFFIFKIKDFRQDIAKLDYFFITNLYKEQYWRLVRLILLNFFIAHLIALIFLLMSNLNAQNNWLTKSNHIGDTQFQKYIWAYYWSVTTMLSVGYGDLVPANPKEAVCVIFVQTISCIALAYTISSVGDLLLNIRNQEIQMKRAFKIFKEIVEKNQVKRSVEEKVHSYIEQAIQIKKRFNFEQQKKFLQDLPSNVKTDLLFECNSKIFDCISLLNIKSYATQSIKELAQRVQLFIAHPEQCILEPTSRQIKILKQGKIGYFAHKNRFTDEKYLINQLKIRSKQNTEMILNSFFSHGHLVCNIKAINYSSIYKIKYEDFVDCLKKNSIDFEIFCIQRDKHRFDSQGKLKDYQFIRDDYVSQKCTLEIRINNHPENISNICRLRSGFHEKIRSKNNITIENTGRRQRRRLRTLKNQCQFVKDVILHPNQLLVQNSLNCKQNEPSRSGRCKMGQTFLDLPGQQTDRLRSKNYILPFEIQQMMGIECDLINDFSVYFPLHNAKCLKKSLKNNVGVKKVKKVGISELQYTTEGKTLRVIE